MNPTMPEVSPARDYPMPPKNVSRLGRKATTSPWPVFLATLQVGQSFLITYSSLQNVKIYAKAQGIGLRWADSDNPLKCPKTGLRLARVWRDA